MLNPPANIFNNVIGPIMGLKLQKNKNILDNNTEYDIII